MDTTLHEFTEEELDRLRALRRAAADINRSSVMRGSRQIQSVLGHDSRVRGSGSDEERFRSFILGLRRTYAQNDAAHFRTVSKIVARRIPSLRDQVNELREAYNSALSGQVTINGSDHEQVFDCWLYGYLIHDDNAAKRARWESIARSPTFSQVAQIVIQSTAIAMADVVIALDGMIAGIFGEPRLRPPAPTPAAEAHSRSSEMRVSVRPQGRRGNVAIDFVNVGASEVRNLTLDQFTPLTPGDEDVLYSGQAKLVFPVPLLRPQERVSVLAGPTHGTPLVWHAALSWDDPSGERLTDNFRVDLSIS